jgi:transketolase
MTEFVKPTPVDTKVSMRQAYGMALSELAKSNQNIVIIDSDISSPPRNWFEANAPDRLFEVGLTEENSIGMAAGLAAEGKIPFWFNMSFLLGQVYTQLRQSVAEDKRNVKIVCYAAGVSGTGGRSHNYVEDMAIMRSIPNFMVLAPADTVELSKMLSAIAEYNGPAYVRFPREPPLPILFEDEYPFKLGKAFVMKDGKDATIIATGSMVSEALIAANRLNRNDLDVGVLDVSCIKPLDIEMVYQAAFSTGLIITAEEHSIIGGLGDAVSSFLSEYYPTPVAKIGVQDQFCTSVQFDGRKYYGLKSDNIVAVVQNVIKHFKGKK